jgi:hypothetical protein
VLLIGSDEVKVQKTSKSFLGWNSKVNDEKGTLKGEFLV